MASSLKSTFPVLGRILGETPDALYAHQRAFVRAGLLELTPGRGPGSGVKASPETLAEFLIGMLTHASTGENVPFAKAIAKARPLHGKCPLTGAKTFQDAFTEILGDKALARRVRGLGVDTAPPGQAFFSYDGARLQDGPERHRKDPPKNSIFMGSVAKPGGLRLQASIAADTLIPLAEMLT